MRSVEEMTNDAMEIMEKNKMRLTQDQKNHLMKEVLTQVLNQHWAQVVPKAVPPVDANGTVHQRNSASLMSALLEHTVFGTGSRPIRADVVVDVIVALDKKFLLDHYPEVVERVVEKPVPTPLTRREAEKAAHDLTKKMNDPNRHPVKGHGEDHKEFIKTPASQQALEAQAKNDLRENEVMGDVRSLIQLHRNSASHAATKYERQILTNVMEAGIERGDAADKILEQVKTQQNSMAKWGPQDALKHLRPDLFQTKRQEW